MRRHIDSGELFRGSHHAHLMGDAASPTPVNPIANLDQLCASTIVRPLELPPGVVPPGHHPTNPSVAVHQGALYATVRCVSYRLPWGRLGSHSVNLFCRLAEDLKVTSSRPMIDHDPAPRCKAPSTGYEDMRLISLGEKLFASATVLDRHEGLVEMALLELTEEGDVASAEVQAMGSPQAEKNWMPVVLSDGALRWIYSTSPTIVRSRGQGPALAASSTPPSREALRGGSQLLPLTKGYLAVVHQIVRPHRYLHRMVRFDQDLHVVKVSELFSFGQAEVEFCAGLARHRPGRLILSFGVNDAEAWLAEVEEEEVLALVT